MPIRQKGKYMRITVWNEFAHEKTDEAVKAIYPDGIHTVVAGFLQEAGYDVGTATLDMPEAGLPEKLRPVRHWLRAEDA